jgi:anthranilate phosphoribosyltransferase
MVGVFREEDMEKLGEAMDFLGVESYAILYGEDERAAPLGELSPLGRNRILGKKGGKGFDISEGAAQGSWGVARDLEASQAVESAAKITAVLSGDGERAVRGAVVWNAGMLLWLAGMAEDWSRGRELAEVTITKGAARALLERWRTWSRATSV